MATKRARQSDVKAKGVNKGARPTDPAIHPFERIVVLIEHVQDVQRAAVIWDGRAVLRHLDGPTEASFLRAADALPKNAKWAWVAAIGRDARPPTDEQVAEFVRIQRRSGRLARPVSMTQAEFIGILISERQAEVGGDDLLEYLRKQLESVHTHQVPGTQPQQDRRAELDLARAQFAARNAGAMSVLKKYADEFESFRATMKVRIQTELTALNQSPPTFESADERRVFASLLMRVLDQLGLRLQCQNPECRQPAMLRGSRHKSTKTGLFEFVHTGKGLHRTHASSVALPLLVVVDAPPHGTRIIL
jgi:hypothetical protein